MSGQGMVETMLDCMVAPEPREVVLAKVSDRVAQMLGTKKRNK